MKLDSPLPTSAGYPLYAALLERSPSSFGDLAHSNGFTLLSQYVVGDEWCVSLLGEESEHAMAHVLESLDALKLAKLNKTVRITGRAVRRIESIDALFCMNLPDKLLLRTPTAFKSGGAYQLLPTQRLLLQSLILKWNGCFGDICPIEDVGEGLDALAQGLVYGGIHLESTGYPLKSTTIPGTLGTIRVKLTSEGFHRQLTCALLHFGSFSGIGIKTALGMGGFALE